MLLFAPTCAFAATDESRSIEAARGAILCLLGPILRYVFPALLHWRTGVGRRLRDPILRYGIRYGTVMDEAGKWWTVSDGKTRRALYKLACSAAVAGL